MPTDPTSYTDEFYGVDTIDSVTEATGRAQKIRASSGLSLVRNPVTKEALLTLDTQWAQNITALLETISLQDPPTLATSSATLWDNSAARVLAMAESRWSLDGSGGPLIVRAASTFPAASSGLLYGPSVWIDGVCLGTMTAPAASGPHEALFNAPIGSQSLVIRNSPLGDNWVGSRVSQLVMRGATRIDPTPPQHRMVIAGDSVLNGWNCANPGVDGWGAKMKSSRANGRVTIWGCGAYSFGSDASIVGGIAALTTNLINLLDGTSSNKLVWALCINDAMSGIWASGGTSAGYAAAVGIVLDAIHAAVPNVQVYLWGPHTCTNALGSSESTVAPYRNALLALAPSRSAWCTAINATAWSVAMDNTDATKLHPAVAGHNTIYQNMRSQLSWY